MARIRQRVREVVRRRYGTSLEDMIAHVCEAVGMPFAAEEIVGEIEKHARLADAAAGGRDFT